MQLHARARDDVVVLDNGGCTIKAGLASAPHAVRCASALPALAPAACLTRAPPDRTPPPRSCVPNCVAKPKGEKRLYVGDELDELRDLSALVLRRPVDRGFAVNAQLQRDIWERLFRRTLQARRGAASGRGALAGHAGGRQGWRRRGSPACAACAAPRALTWRASAPPQVTPSECSLLVTEPLFNLPVLMARVAFRSRAHRAAQSARRAPRRASADARHGRGHTPRAAWTR
jgi:hypothetical protein